MRVMQTAENTPITLAGLSYQQKRWLALALACVGLLLLWRPTQTAWPSIPMTVLGCAIHAAGTVAFFHFINSIPKYRPILPWFAGAAVGALLNLVVLIANGGYMPVAGLEQVKGLHAPMEGARLAILADWIMGGISPGDVLLIACGVGIVVTLVRQWRAKGIIITRRNNERSCG